MNRKALVIGTVITIGMVALYVDRRTIRAELAALRLAATPTADPVTRSEIVWMAQPNAQAPVEAPSAKPKPATASSYVATLERPPPRPAESPIEEFAPVHDAVETAFGSEAHDGAWAMEARRTVDARLAMGLSLKSAIKSIDCRSTICRIESAHDSYADAKAFMSRLTTSEGRPWNGAFYTGPVAQEPRNGAVTFVTYLAREGVDLPAIPDQASDEQTVR